MIEKRNGQIIARHGSNLDHRFEWLWPKVIVVAAARHNSNEAMNITSEQQKPEGQYRDAKQDVIRQCAWSGGTVSSGVRCMPLTFLVWLRDYVTTWPQTGPSASKPTNSRVQNRDSPLFQSWYDLISSWSLILFLGVGGWGCVCREREREWEFSQVRILLIAKKTQYKNFNTLNTQINFNPLTYK